MANSILDYTTCYNTAGKSARVQVNPLYNASLMNNESQNHSNCRRFCTTLLAHSAKVVAGVKLNVLTIPTRCADNSDDLVGHNKVHKSTMYLS